MLYKVLFIFWMIAFIVWLAGLMGYPIYKKVIKKVRFDWLWYALWLNISSLILNICTLLMRLVRQ